MAVADRSGAAATAAGCADQLRLAPLTRSEAENSVIGPPVASSNPLAYNSVFLNAHVAEDRQREGIRD